MNPIFREWNLAEFGGVHDLHTGGSFANGLGEAAALLDRKPGADMASSRGRAIATPAVRRKVRRGIGLMGMAAIYLFKNTRLWTTPCRIVRKR